jgi:hypothetical protein
LCVHNVQLADPLGKWSKAMKAISSKRKKVDADLEELAKLEWFGSLYLNHERKVIVPAECIQACMIAAAKRTKEGPKAKLAIQCEDLVIEHDGPQDIEKLWDVEDYRYYRPVRIGGKSTVMRMRPIFRKWAGTVIVTFDDGEVNEAMVRAWVRDAGLKIGLCERRPMFGRFEVVAR